MHSIKNENPTTLNFPKGLKLWWIASRPKTWSASICPVLIGTHLAAQTHPISIILFLCLFFFSLCVQIGTNYANDYFDFMKGVDTGSRIGPKRAVQQGWIAPRRMLHAALFLFICALACAFPVMLHLGLWSLCLALTCVVCGILYTGGPCPLGYLGYGEVLVFLFFGPIAVMGSYFVYTSSLSCAIFSISLIPGFLCSSILTVNNLRDELSDASAHKKTIVVRFGKKFGQWTYCASIATAAMLSAAYNPWTLLGFIPYLLCIRSIFRYQKPEELLPVLGYTSLSFVYYTLVFCCFAK